MFGFLKGDKKSPNSQALSSSAASSTSSHQQKETTLLDASSSHLGDIMSLYELTTTGFEGTHSSVGAAAVDNKALLGLKSSAPIQIQYGRRRSTMENSIYTFRQLFTPPTANQESATMLGSSSPSESSGSNRFHDRFDMSHLFERRHSMGALSYTQSSTSFNESMESSFENKFRTRASSVTEGGVYSQQQQMSDEPDADDYKPVKKDPMKYMMLKGQLMDF